MPIYEYSCSKCNHGFSLRRSISEMDAPASCPQCGDSETQRRISLFFATNTGSTTAAATSPSTKVRHV